MTTTTALIPATYKGSLTPAHGPVEVELDRDAIARIGELRFVAWLPDGSFLRQVSPGSLDFSPRPVTPPPVTPPVFPVIKVIRRYCPRHDFFECPYC